MKLLVTLLTLAAWASAAPATPGPSWSPVPTRPRLHGGMIRDKPVVAGSAPRPTNNLPNHTNSTSSSSRILRFQVGETVIPLDLDWTQEEMEDRMPDIPTAARYAACSHYCKTENRLDMSAKYCMNFCIKSVEKHAQKERLVHGKERARDLGIKSGITPWEPVLPLPQEPTMKRRSTPGAFQNISRAQMDRAVVAYDCSVPTLLETVQIPEKKATDCTEQRTRVILQANATLNVLQRVETFPVRIYRCKVKQTTIPTGCGMHSHQWLVHPWVEIERELTIPEEECRRMWKTQKYVDARGKTHSLKTESRNTVYSYLAGGIDTSSNNFGYCSGETMKKGNTIAHDMVISQHKTIDLHSFEATSDRQGKVNIPQENLVLPCNVLAQTCFTQTGSYFWERVDFTQHCPLYRTRQVNGIIVTDEGGRKSFISRDNSLVRLRLKGAAVWCNHTVYETNFQRIFVSEDISQPLFNRPLTQASEASLVTYVNAQDYFLSGFLTERIQKEHDVMQRNDCLQMVEERQLDYASLAAAQNVPVEGTTVALGAGYFASARGDAYAKYRCKSILVMARNVDRCYAALPVTLSAKDENDYRLARGWPVGTNASDVEFFVTPNSHLLTTKGIEVECIPMMAPMFRGAYGSWITHTPEATFVSAEPVTLQLTRSEVEEADKWELPDFENGGIYETEFVLALDRQRQLSRATADVTVTLGRKAEETGWSSGQYMGPSGPQLSLPGISIPTVSEILWSAFYNWGVFVAGVIGLIALAFAVSCMAGFLCRLRGIPFHPGATRAAHAAVAAFPSLGNYWRRRHRRYRQPEQDIEEMQPIIRNQRLRRAAPPIPATEGHDRTLQRSPTRQRAPHRPSLEPVISPQTQVNRESLAAPEMPPILEEVTLNSFGLSSPLSSKRELLHHAPLGNLATPAPGVLQACVTKIEHFEKMLRSERPDAALDNLKEKILREVLHLKGRIRRALELNRPLDESSVAQELTEIRKRYFTSRSHLNSPALSCAPTPETHSAHDLLGMVYHAHQDSEDEEEESASGATPLALTRNEEPRALLPPPAN